MFGQILKRLAKVWIVAAVFLTIIAVFIIPYRSGVPVPILGRREAGPSLVADWAIPTVVTFFVAISVGILISSILKWNRQRVSRSSQDGQVTSAGSVSAPPRQAEVTPRLTELLACSRCSSAAVKQFGFTNEPVCDQCFDRDGVCSSCGRQFASDAELVIISAGKNCRECDAKLGELITEGFASRTIVR